MGPGGSLISGLSPGTSTLEGALELKPGSTTEIEIAGSDPGIDFDLSSPGLRAGGWSERLPEGNSLTEIPLFQRRAHLHLVPGQRPSPRETVRTREKAGGGGRFAA